MPTLSPRISRVKIAAWSVLAALLWYVLANHAQAQHRVIPRDDYLGLIAELLPFVDREVKDKDLGALSIALVDDRSIVWARGFGHQDQKKTIPAAADTIYRVGSVSKLFTDIAVMQLVEQGKLDLDAPVTNYLPEFQPKNALGKAITMRHLMAHRSGLVREPPVGHYFDPTDPTLAATVASLNDTTLVLAPGAKTKYSNAAIAVVGRVLEHVQKTPFDQAVYNATLEPLTMEQSSFVATAAVRRSLADARMWTYHGREFPAPTFPLGMAPAGSMYTSVLDLGKFLGAVMNGGQPLLKPESLAEMLKPQFAKEGTKTGFGLGFMIGELDGKRRIGHGGAIYGFSTELAFLPDQKLGVVVVAARDVTNEVVERIADVALRGMLASKDKKDVAPIVATTPLTADEVRDLRGRYLAGTKAIDLFDQQGKLYLLPARGGYRIQVRKLGNELGDHLVTDDATGYGVKFKRDGDTLVVDKDKFIRTPVARPEACPAKWLDFIGEYGWDHNVLYVLEKEGKLHALIEWFFLYPLDEVSEGVFQFPNFGLYHDEKLVFRRDGAGKVVAVSMGDGGPKGVDFKRRTIPGVEGPSFRIQPRRPVAELRKEALASKPPTETGRLEKPDLVDLTTLDATLKLDVRYATADNFLGTPVYTSARAFLQRPAAEALVRVHKKLAEQGYGLLIHDAYRPWYVTKIFWDATPEAHHTFVANPAQGSRHNRGCAVDLTLYDLRSGKAVEMVGLYDEFSDRSYPGYLGGTSLQRWHRELLRRAMENEGFTVYEAEWWHFDYKDWKKYPVSSPDYAQADAALTGKR